MQIFRDMPVGLKLDERGAIAVDAECRTNLSGVWAVGHFLTGGQFERYMILPMVDPYLPWKVARVAKVFLLGAPVLLIAANFVRENRWPLITLVAYVIVFGAAGWLDRTRRPV